MNPSNRTKKKIVQFLTRNFMFDLNDAVTRKAIRTKMKKKFGLHVICDERNNPSDLIDQNGVCVEIYFKFQGLIHHYVIVSESVSFNE